MLGGQMNRKFLLGWLIVFVCWMAGSFVVHGALLSADYTALQGKLFRTPEDSQNYFALMILAHVLLSGSLVWIYARGKEAGRPWLGQGLRFGIAIALLTVVPTYTIYFVVQPMPAMLAAKQILFDGVLMLLLGVIVAWWLRD
jgi:hypothetical protein